MRTQTQTHTHTHTHTHRAPSMSTEHELYTQPFLISFVTVVTNTYYVNITKQRVQTLKLFQTVLFIITSLEKRENNLVLLIMQKIRDVNTNSKQLFLISYIRSDVSLLYTHNNFGDDSWRASETSLL